MERNKVVTEAQVRLTDGVCGRLGLAVGWRVGWTDSVPVVGVEDGWAVAGLVVGIPDGWVVGLVIGAFVGMGEGDNDGEVD